MTIREKLLSAIDNPQGWDMPGLLRDAVAEIDRIPAYVAELEDYCATVRQLRRKLASIRETAGAA